MSVFSIFKYVIYVLLAINAYLFLQEDYLSSEFTHGDGFSLFDLASAFAAGIDTVAWLVLLLILEMKTTVLAHRKANPLIDWGLSLLSALCGAAILYALYGYITTLVVPYGFAPFQGAAPCTFVGSGASLAYTLAEYVPLDAANCGTLVGDVYFNANLNMFATKEVVELIEFLAWIDVINASVWVIIVIILELEVYLQSSKLFGSKFFLTYKASKFVLYGILFVNAYLWWAGDAPLDAWDAVLWIVAFFFIELNLLDSQGEAAAERKKRSLAPE